MSTPSCSAAWLAGCFDCLPRRRRWIDGDGQCRPGQIPRRQDAAAPGPAPDGHPPSANRMMQLVGTLMQPLGKRFPFSGERT